MRLFITLIIILVLSFGLSEFFGRSKHIGRGWSLLLLSTFGFFGIIALISSPSANAPHTKGTSTHTGFGWFFVISGIYSVFQFFSKIANGLDPTLPATCFGLVAMGIYLIKLGKSEKINSDPKFYFQNNNPNQNSSNSKKSTNTGFKSTNSDFDILKKQTHESNQRKQKKPFSFGCRTSPLVWFLVSQIFTVLLHTSKYSNTIPSPYPNLEYLSSNLANAFYFHVSAN